MTCLLISFITVHISYSLHNLLLVFEWKANRQLRHNMITQGDMPGFILDSYEECHGLPHLFMLDKHGNVLFYENLPKLFLLCLGYFLFSYLTIFCTDSM
uniref:Uncharacterized protein n=1 Tax=Arundo donax TaxID=35708 RepID=A0A0A9BIL2_ARUDO